MIVLGLGYGDEGKGLTTSFLCAENKDNDPIVVRFNGGHQAGHTVVDGSTHHVFSSFGAGTLQGVPTLWSHHCTFSPTAFANEHYILTKEKGINDPIVYVHPLCPVTTPFDLLHNKRSEDRLGKNRHGSVGVGFGSTIERHENHYKLYVKDLKYPNVVYAKLNNIINYYGLPMTVDISETIAKFMDDIKYVIPRIAIIDYEDIHKLYRRMPTFIFEGAQGILLDQEFGFFPNVTRSNTTSKNAIELARILYRDPHYNPTIYYVTRSYQTRHGAGFMSDEQELPLTNNENETNQSHDYQGDFRIGKMDIDMIKYAMESDATYSSDSRINLMITCMDQHPIEVEELLQSLKYRPDRVFLSFGPNRSSIKSFI